jgi:hypothetical protein
MAPRYLVVTMSGGGWTPPGGGWKRPENATPRRFDLVKPQLNNIQRGLAGVGGGYFEVYTYEFSQEASQAAKTHMYAVPRLTTPANPRRTSVPISRSHDVTTEAGAR